MCPFPYAATSSMDRVSVADGEEEPQTGDPPQFVLATLAEVDSGAHDEVLDHSRYEDLTRCGKCPDAGRDMDRQSAQILSPHFAFACMQSHAQIDVE